MPPTSVMHGGTLPLNSLLSFVSKSNSEAASPPPEFTHTLSFDSTRLLSGLLSSFGGIEYAIATRGTKTVISCPGQSSNAAVIEWKDGWVETEGLRIRLDEWESEPGWGSSNTRVFKKWGRNPLIRWEENKGEWKAIDSKKQVLAAFIVRRGALGSRIELTDAGWPIADALVLTGILSITREGEWRWHTHAQARREAVEAAPRYLARPMADEANGEPPDRVMDESLPNYGEAPFTRPLGPLFSYAPPLADHGSEPAPRTDRPLKLTLASRHLLNGTWYEDDQPLLRVQTIGPQTKVSRLIHTSRDHEPAAKVVGAINWAEGRVTVLGEEVELNRALGRGSKASIFTKSSRKSQVCTLLALTSHWTTTSSTSSRSIYPDPDAHIRYECRASPPENRPLGLLTHYVRRKGSTLDVTPEGHGALAQVLIGALILIYGSTGKWKEVAGVGLHAEGELSGLVVGEEMVSDLDGWAGPVELMGLRRQERNELPT